jgi:hypothetical protein
LHTILPFKYIQESQDESSGNPRHRHTGSFEGQISLPLIRTTVSNRKPLYPCLVRSQKNKKATYNSRKLCVVFYGAIIKELLDYSNWCRISCDAVVCSTTRLRHYRGDISSLSNSSSSNTIERQCCPINRLDPTFSNVPINEGA